MFDPYKTIELLGMQPHPEGGYYAEAYKTNGIIPALALTQTHHSFRPFMTSIYFLLLPGQVSRLHRLKSDEIWYFHAGNALDIHTIDEKGYYGKLSLGNEIETGQKPQQAVSPGLWFGASLKDDSQAALVSCAVAPGFSFADFELGQKELLLQQFPQHHKIISRLT